MEHQINRIIRKPAAFEMAGLSPSVGERLIRSNQFPRPIPLIPNGRAVGFLLSEVQEWIDGRVALRKAA